MALLFLVDDTSIRTAALVIGGGSDFLDGFLARRYNLKSRLGTWLDPILDKFFVLFVLTTLWLENRMTLGLAGAFLSRDVAVACFGAYLLISGKLKSYTVESFFWGKVATILQFAVLLALIQHVAIPFGINVLFILIGVLSFRELYRTGERVGSL